MFYWQKTAYSAAQPALSSSSRTPIDLDLNNTSSSDYGYTKDANMHIYTANTGKTFKSVKDDVEIWKGTGAGNYSNKVEVDVVTAENKAVTVHLDGNNTKVFRKHGKGKPWNEIDTTKLNPQSVNIKYKYDSYFYTNTETNNVRTFQAKTGFAFNVVNEYVSNNRVEIWKTDQVNDYANKVVAEASKVTIYTGEGNNAKTKVFNKGSDDTWSEGSSGGGAQSGPMPRARSAPIPGGTATRASTTVKLPDDDDDDNSQSSGSPGQGAGIATPGMPRARSAPVAGGTAARTSSSIALPEDEEEDKPQSQATPGAVAQPAATPGMPKARSAPASGAVASRAAASFALPEDDDDKSQPPATPGQGAVAVAQPAATPGMPRARSAPVPGGTAARTSSSIALPDDDDKSQSPATPGMPRARSAPVPGGTASRTATSVELPDDDKSQSPASPPQGAGLQAASSPPSSALEAAMGLPTPGSPPTAVPVAKAAGTPAISSGPKPVAASTPSLPSARPVAAAQPVAKAAASPVSSAGVPVANASKKELVISIPAKAGQAQASPVASSVPAPKPVGDASSAEAIAYGLNPFDLKFVCVSSWSDEFGEDTDGSASAGRKLMFYKDQTWKSALCDDLANFKTLIDDLKSQQNSKLASAS